MSDTPIEQLKNLGPQSTKMLNSIGIHTERDLREFGVVNAYLLLKQHHAHINLVMLWALQGALLDWHWNEIPTEMKEVLKAQVRAAESEL